MLNTVSPCTTGCPTTIRVPGVAIEYIITARPGALFYALGGVVLVKVIVGAGVVLTVDERIAKRQTL